jgi:hypothetical protein
MAVAPVRLAGRFPCGTHAGRVAEDTSAAVPVAAVPMAMHRLT